MDNAVSSLGCDRIFYGVNAMNRLLCLTLAGMICVVYANSFDGVFVFDDFHAIVRNVSIQEPTFESIRTAYGATRTLVAASIATNFWVGGLNPLGYHLFNLGVHVACALILFDLTCRLLKSSSFSSGQQTAIGRQQNHSKDVLRISFVAALLFALHPLQTAAVTYVIQRMESMAAFFSLLVVYCLIRSTQSKRAVVWACASFLSYALAMISKEVAVTAPVIALLVDRVYLTGSWRKVWLARKWLYLSYLLPLALFFWHLAPQLQILQRDYGETVTLGVGPVALESRTQALEMSQEERSQDPLFAHFNNTSMPVIRAEKGVSLIPFIRSQPAVILHYLRLVVIPVGQCFDYQWQPEQSPLKITLTSAFVILLILGSGWFVLSPGNATRLHQLMLPLLIVFILLSPRSTFQVLDLAVEYRMYLPLAAITPMVALGLHFLSRRLAGLVGVEQKTLFAALSAGICISLANYTIQRNSLYASRQALWGDVVRVSPLNARAHMNYSFALNASGNWSSAMDHARRSVELFSQPHVQQLDPAHAYRVLGDRWLDMGDKERAQEAYGVALRLNPSLEIVRERLEFCFE